MVLSSTRNTQRRFLLPDVRIALTTGFTAAAFLACTLGAPAQDTAPATPDSAAQTAQPATGSAQQNDINLTNQKQKKSRRQQQEEKQEQKNQNKVVQSKDTKKEDKKVQKDNPLLGVDAKLPDKQLYDKAEDAIKHGKFDVGRLDLQTLLNTYPDSQFQMRAKLAIADSWYKEGGTAALTQAEQEYKDFITFFPNAPEAGEAQMRVGDIYFRQMDKPDRDPINTVKAEQEYRLMLQQFPDSPLVPQARQRLREVQEVLAYRDADTAAFYAGRLNWPAAIARYQTVADTYPLYSHMDDVLIGLGDAYEAEAHIVRGMRLPEAAKARLEKIDDDMAADAYRRVVLEHSAAPHVEDAKDRLVGMGLPVPTPTPQQVAASETLENSRGQYTLKSRATVFLLHQADTVPAATVGAPPLEDARPTLAPALVKKSIDDFNDALNPSAPPRPGQQLPSNEASAAAAGGATPAAPTAPLKFEDVPSAGAGSDSGSASAVTSVPQSTAAPSGSGGTQMGIQIVQPTPGAKVSTTPGNTAFPGTTPPADATPAASGDPAQANPQVKPANDNGGISAVGPPNSTEMAPVQKADQAPAAVNEAASSPQPPAQTKPTNGSKAKADCDKSSDSCSNHKKKKGLGKLNPF